VAVITIAKCDGERILGATRQSGWQRREFTASKSLKSIVRLSLEMRGVARSRREARKGGDLIEPASVIPERALPFGDFEGRLDRAGILEHHWRQGGHCQLPKKTPDQISAVVCETRWIARDHFAVEVDMLALLILLIASFRRRVTLSRTSCRGLFCCLAA
jgi:hypothetical protein